jgi:putative transcriptional regulator
MKNLYWGGDFETIKNLILQDRIGQNEIRFFLGYAGWSPKQLENELSGNAWVVADLDAETIMRSSNLTMWQETLNKLGSKYKTWVNFPENPGLN